ncbi:hypothetical protein AB0N31_01490 [Streptomyces sp. NPDC051051]|uniref:hypothetical protein n=1 Tax=Streptomyces sp. NPDC051051 TaxID=3155666 RepID=UPI003417915D
MPVSASNALTVAAAALAGSGVAVTALLWWKHRSRTGRDPIHAWPPSLGDPRAMSPEDLLHRHWNTLQPLDLTR